MDEEQQWYAVRCVFRGSETPEWQPPDIEPGQTVYEERITLWRAASFDDAIARAEAEAQEYAPPDFVYAEFAQAYRLFDEPGDGAEVFSLMRYSALATGDYLDRHFDDGGEREQKD